MTEIPVVLFPHTHVERADADSLLDRFREVTVCLPWHMNSPIIDGELPQRSNFRVVRPPDTHQPPEDFTRLLNEYRKWMDQNRGTGYAAVFASSQDGDPSDGRIWEVREMLRGESQAAGDDIVAKVLRWHMVLHLNREFQEHQRDMQLLVRRIKEQTSPLKGALGGEGSPAQDLLDDLPEPMEHPFGDDHHLQRVCEAWIHLFGDQLKDPFSLVTLNRCVLDLIADLFQARGVEPPVKRESFGSGESQFGVPACDTLYLPETLPDGGADLNSLVGWLMGKRIALWGA